MFSWILLQGRPPSPGSQGGGGGGQGGAGCNGPFECIPIDDNVMVLVVIGLLLGIYYLVRERYEKRRERF